MKSMLQAVLVSGLSAGVSLAAVTLDFNVGPAYSGSGGRQLVEQDWLQFNFSVDGAGTVALDAETGSTNATAQTIVNGWDSPDVGTVTEPGLFGASFQLTATATDQGGTSPALIYLQGEDTGVLAIQGENAGRIDGVGGAAGPEFLSWTMTSNSTDVVLRFSQWTFGNGFSGSDLRVQDLDTTQEWPEVGSSSGALALSGMSISSTVAGDFLRFSEMPAGSHGAGLSGLTFDVALASFSLVAIVPTVSGFDLSWESQSNKLYNLRSSEDLSADPFTWTLVETNMVATPGTNSISVSPAEPGLVYAVEEFPTPPSLVIVPSGTANDSALIQNALDQLQAGDTLLLSGDFVIRDTIYLPSNFKWILDGSLSLADGADDYLDDVGWYEELNDANNNIIDARRRTGISETPGGAVNIEMTGGSYYGNSTSNTKSLRFINFVSVTNSYFHDMVITDVSDDNFTIGPGSNGNILRNLVGSSSVSGNALTDKGDHNTWYDCIAEDCGSDGFTPKCRYSEFYRCIARRNEGPGFGMYCRIDGSGNPDDLGEAINGNQFVDCVSWGNNAAGFSFNISGTSGEGGTIISNYVEAVCYSNASSGVRFRNKQPNSVVADNEINLLCYGNRGEKKDGTLSTLAGGLGTDASFDYPVTGITGTMVSFDNIQWDVNIGKAYDCDITVYHPDGENAPVLKTGDPSNSITVIGFSCSDPLVHWCMQAYCDLVSP